LNLKLLSRDQPCDALCAAILCAGRYRRGSAMFAKKVLYFVSTVIAFALIAGTTVLCLAADNTMPLY
jgi:hypothetical protein